MTESCECVKKFFSLWLKDRIEVEVIAAVDLLQTSLNLHAEKTLFLIDQSQLH